VAFHLPRGLRSLKPLRGKTGAPEHAALVIATLATVKPQREHVGHGFSRDYGDPRAVIGEIGERARVCELAALSQCRARPSSSW
jgi:hypothetical protein